MSADLFAEFNQLSSGPSPPQQQQQQQPPKRPESLHSNFQPTSQVQDPFDFFQSANTAAQQRPISTGGFSNAFVPVVQSPQAQSAADDDDGWGDFEVAEPSSGKKAASPWQPPVSSSNVRAPDPVPAPQPAIGNRLRASTMDIMTNNLVDIGPVSQATPPALTKVKVQVEPLRKQKVKAKQKWTSSDPDVLFDADDFELQTVDDQDEEDEDDFGDFETVSPTKVSLKPKPAKAVQSEPPPSMDLLSLDDSLTPKTTHEQAASSKSSTGLAFGATVPKENKAAKSSGNQAAKNKNNAPSVSKSKTIAKSTIDEEDEWSAWDEFEPTSGASQASATKATTASDSWDWGSVETPPSTTKPPQNKGLDENSAPPINVPPPSIILSAFPPLLTSGNSLFKPLAGQSSSIKQRVLSDPKAVEFLTGYVLLASTAAHVIAGRKHRWHRDKILAKSMSISAAGSKGMKLAGVDKTQAAREDREAADIASTWRELVGRVRSAVAAVNSEGLASLKVPEISDTLQVHTAKLVPTAPNPCVICGLKRDERVNKVDFDIEDSFGEWWVDHWGHRVCKSFWIEHEQLLRQR